MKYITTEKEDGTKELFMFPRHIDHDAFAEALEGFRNQTYGNWERKYRKPVSAGFVSNNVCYGESGSLNIKSTKDDTKLLLLQMNK